MGPQGLLCYSHGFSAHIACIMGRACTLVGPVLRVLKQCVSSLIASGEWEFRSYRSLAAMNIEEKEVVPEGRDEKEYCNCTPWLLATSKLSRASLDPAYLAWRSSGG